MSLTHRLGSHNIFSRPNENTITPKRVVFLSVEGNKTEVSYFRFIDRHREKIGIKSIIHIEVLQRKDTQSDPDSVLQLLEEYISFRESGNFTEELQQLELQSYDFKFIQKYLQNDPSISPKDRNKFDAILKQEQIDLLYLNFLNTYHGDDDIFGIVIDRDCGSHSEKQIEKVRNTCNENNYHFFITNPCFEFWRLLHVSDVKMEFSNQLETIKANPLDEHGHSYVSNLLYCKTNERKAIQEKNFLQYYLPNIDLAIERSKQFAKSDCLIHQLGSNLGDLFVLLRE